MIGPLQRMETQQEQGQDVLAKKWTEWHTDSHQFRPSQHVGCTKNVVQLAATSHNSKCLFV